MVYFIRAKSYYRYALELFKDLYLLKEKPEDFKRRVKSILELGLKSIWALSQINPPEKAPSLEEVYSKVLETLSSEEKEKMEKFYKEILSQELSEEEVIEALRNFLNLIKSILSPIL